MGKIRKIQSAKHEASLSPATSSFIKTSISIPLWQLPRHLDSFPASWPFPRGDLYHWIPLLNRFDDILAAVVKAYAWDQSPEKARGIACTVLCDIASGATEFTAHLTQQYPHGLESTKQLKDLGFADDGDRVLLESILAFSTLLVDNCGNRSLYASSALLGHLLNCTTLSVVAATLRLSLRLAGRYSASRLRNMPVGGHLPPILQPLLQQHYQLDLAKVEKLAQPFVKNPSESAKQSENKETGVTSTTSPAFAPDLVSLVYKDSDSVLKEIYGTAWISYPQDTTSTTEKSMPQAPEIFSDPASPTPVRRTSALEAPPTQSRPYSTTDAESSTPTHASDSRQTKKAVFEVSTHTLDTSSFVDVIKESLAAVPEAHRYELLCRLRTARAFRGSTSDRHEAVAVRILAIANLAHIYPEHMLQEKVLWQDIGAPRQSQLPHQLRDLIHTPGINNAVVPKYLQAFALATLEALTNYKAKAMEVLSSFDVNVSHGALSYVLRKFVADMSEEGKIIEDKWEREYRDALFNFLPTLPRTFPRAAESLASAGLFEILVDGLRLRTPAAEQNHQRIVNFLDLYVYNTRDTFPALVTAKGLDVTAELLVHEIDLASSDCDAGKGLLLDYKTQHTDYKIPFTQQQTLRTLFRLISHIMGIGAAGFDRLLRNLIESAEMLASLRKVVAKPALYGSAVWCGAIRVFSEFLNAEPTSFAAVAEAGLTTTFLETVIQRKIVESNPAPAAGDVQDLEPPITEATSSEASVPDELGPHAEQRTSSANARHLKAVLAMEERLSQGILPSVEAISSVPLGFSTICLNDVGLNQLRQSKALRYFFFVFLSSPHVKAMASSDADEVESLGAQFDELTRHHPRLKSDIVQLVWNMTALLANRHRYMGRTGIELLLRDDEGHPMPDRTNLQANSSSPLSVSGPASFAIIQSPADVEMGGVAGVTSVSDETSQVEALDIGADNMGPHGRTDDSQNGAKRATNMEYYLVFCKFLLGFFSNPQLVQPFSETPGIDKLIDLATSPMLPYDFGNSPAAQKLVKIFQIFVEDKPHMVLPRLVRRLLGALRELDVLIAHPSESSFFAIFVTPADSKSDFTEVQRKAIGQGSTVMQNLLIVQVLSLILAKCLPNSAHGSRSTPNGFAAVNLTDMYVEIIDILGKLQARCIWESTLLEKNAPRAWLSTHTNLHSKIAQEGPANNVDIMREMNSASHSAHPDMPGIDDSFGENGLPNGSSAEDSGSTERSRISTEQRNLTAIRHLLNHIPASTGSSFQMIGKSLLMKRAPSESYHKQNSITVAEHIAQALVGVLEYKLPSESSVKMIDYYRYISVSLVTQALIDRRADSMDRPGPQILSLVLQAFRKFGGLKQLSQIAMDLFQRSIVSGPESLEDVNIRGPKGGHRCSFEGLQAILRFLGQITSQKQVSDSVQAETMARGERDRTSPDYFSKPQFLVELRTDGIKAIEPMWETDLIDQASPVTVKHICAILKNVLDSQGEHGATQRADTVSVRTKASRKHWRMRQPDHLTRLTAELGVAEDLAKEAFFRCADNYAAAKEYCSAYVRDPSLLRNPIPESELPPEEGVGGTSEENSSEPLTEGTPSLQSSMSPVEGDSTDLVRQIISRMGAVDAGEVAEEATEAEPQTTSHETQSAQDSEITTLEDLDQERSNIKSNIMDRSLMILGSFKTKSLTFELADVIIAAVSKGEESEEHRSEAIETLMNSLISFQGNDIQDVHEDVASYAHLLGLLLQDPGLFAAAKETLKENFASLLTFLQIPQSRKTGEHASWISNVLLIIERILSEDAQPHKVSWNPPSVDQPPPVYEPVAALVEPMISKDEKYELFGIMLNLLPKIGQEVDFGLAVIRVILILTRNRQMAKTLGERRNMAGLSLMIRQLLTHGMVDEKIQAAIMLVLRHVVEDEESIRQIMRTEIKAFFAGQSRGVEPSAYTRQLFHLVLRDPELFVDVTNELVMLPRYDRQLGSPQLALKKDESSQVQESGAHEENAASQSVEAKEDMVDKDLLDKPKGLEVKAPVVENPDGVIHFLLSELLAYKDVTDKSKESVGSELESKKVDKDVEMLTDDPPSNNSGKRFELDEAKDVTDEKRKFTAEDHPIFLYRCFLLNTLTELLQSYNRTKVEFINFSRRSDPQAATPSKPRSGVLNYLLNVLIPQVSLKHADDINSDKNASTSNAAIGVVVALCSRTSEKRPNGRREAFDTDDEPDLLFVRRFVLEHALKAFRDTTFSVESAETKYPKLLALADMFNRMLAARQDLLHRSSRDASNPSLIPTQKQLAKIMFEKNFIAAFNQAILDIDLNVSGANRAVKYILRPLNLLTHTAIELSMTSDLSTTSGQTDDNDISSATSVSDTGEVREETPDLFRNSTLGMFEPNHGDDESEQSITSSDEDDGEDPFENAYADDMEYDEDDHIHGEDVISDEDEEMEGIGPIEGIPGDVPMELQIDLEDDHDDDSEEDDLDHDRIDDDEEEDDSESVESDDEDDEQEIQILEEIIDDDGASADEGQDMDEWEDEDETEDHYADLEDVHEIEDEGESASDDDIEDNEFAAGAMDALRHNVVDMEDGLEEDDDNDSDEGDEEDGEDYDEEEEMDLSGAGYDVDDADNDSAPFNFWPPHSHRRHAHHRGHRHQWTTSIPHHDNVVVSGYPPGYRSYANGRLGAHSGRLANDTTNPLLSRSRVAHDETRSGTNSGFDNVQAAAHVRRLIETDVRDRLGLHVAGDDPNPLAYIENLINVLGSGGQPLGLQTGADGTVSISLNAMPPNLPHFHGPMGRMSELEYLSFPHRGHIPPHPTSSIRDARSAVAFEPIPTTQRWQDEAKLLFGSDHAQKCLFVIGAFLRLLVGPAIEAHRIRKEEERKQQEERDRQQAEREEKERKEREEREEREAAEKAEAEAAAARERAEREADKQVETENSLVGDTEAMQGVETTVQQADSTQSSAEVQRVYTNIRGRQVDITSLGIDVEVLEALPEEMREEVIAQQYVEQRSTARESGEAEEPTAISSEFLDALPPDIREEIVQQEAQERRRREREEARRRSQASGIAAQPEEMDPASFMASLDPTLRATVLAEADDDMLASLPAEIAAEARALGGHHRRRAVDPSRLFGNLGLESYRGGYRDSGRDPNADQNEEADTSSQRRAIVQMIDKAGVATLLRLLFVPVAGNARSSLSGIFRNACGNRQTRQDVISGLLSILQDGSSDLSAVERSFTHLTLRAKQTGSVSKTPQSSRKTQQAPVLPGSDANPTTVISQTLAALVDLVRYINHVPQFFLTENEAFGIARAKTVRKGKSKETKSLRYPINVLLSLLDRDTVINNVPIMEQLASVLSSITMPLNNLLRKEKEEKEAKKLEETHADSELPAEQDTTMTGTEASADDSAEAPSAELKSANITDEAKKPRGLVPPEIPQENLRMVVNILSARDCTSKTFRDTLSTMTYLSAIPNAHNVLSDELIKQARQLGQTIHAKLELLVTALGNAENEMAAQNAALANFSPTGSDQSKFNRILTALDYLFEAKIDNTDDDKRQENAKPISEEGKAVLANLYNDNTFIELWQQLSGCLSATQKDEKYFPNVATILLPLIEALMVVCKRIPTVKARKEEAESQERWADSKMRSVFFSFTNKHRKILNDLVRNNPKLMSGSFSVLVKNSGVLEFDNKRNFFTRKLHHRNADQRHHHHPPLSINVRREQVFLDSYKGLYYKSPEEIKYGKLNIHFHHEEGVDAGGITREWFQVLARQMFNPDYALFNPVASDRTTFHPNSLSSVNEEHLEFFKFIGRIIGKALYENRVLDCHFSRAVYKRILGKAVSMKDMETIDLDYTKGMEWILHNDITDVITETFSLTQNVFGVEEIIDLVDNGRDVAVTEENKEEYVKLVTEFKLLGSIKTQLECFLEGFHEIVPAELISIFDEGELELLISGMPDVDIDDWKTNTEYHSYTANSPQIQWFWRAVRSFDKEERAKLLQFVTGTGKVPLNGFKELEGMNGFTRFSIHKDFGNKDRLPSSHTCFNQLDLPEYDNYEILRKSLYTAMTTGADFFGLI